MFDCIARSCIRSKKLNFLVRKISRESNSGEKGLATAESEFDIAGIEKKYISGRRTFQDTNKISEPKSIKLYIKLIANVNILCRETSEQ